MRYGRVGFDNCIEYIRYPESPYSHSQFSPARPCRSRASVARRRQSEAPSADQPWLGVRLAKPRRMATKSREFGATTDARGAKDVGPSPNVARNESGARALSRGRFLPCFVIETITPCPCARSWVLPGPGQAKVLTTPVSQASILVFVCFTAGFARLGSWMPCLICRFEWGCPEARR